MTRLMLSFCSLLQGLLAQGLKLDQVVGKLRLEQPYPDGRQAASIVVENRSNSEITAYTYVLVAEDSAGQAFTHEETVDMLPLLALRRVPGLKMGPGRVNSFRRGETYSTPFVAPLGWPDLKTAKTSVRIEMLIDEHADAVGRAATADSVFSARDDDALAYEDALKALDNVAPPQIGAAVKAADDELQTRIARNEPHSSIRRTGERKALLANAEKAFKVSGAPGLDGMKKVLRAQLEALQERTKGTQRKETKGR